MTSSLVGSEMCIRDSPLGNSHIPPTTRTAPCNGSATMDGNAPARAPAVSYTHLTLPTICSV
eukprot:11715912-Prorocentrum_lima.AAC.1